MDAEACLQRLYAAIRDANYSEAVQALDNYYQWRVKGGAEPHNGDTRATFAAAKLADSLE